MVFQMVAILTNTWIDKMKFEYKCHIINASRLHICRETSNKSISDSSYKKRDPEKVARNRLFSYFSAVSLYY